MGNGLGNWGEMLNNTQADEYILDGWNGLGQATMDAGADITSLLGLAPNPVSKFFRGREQMLKDAEFFPGKVAKHSKLAGDLILAGGLAKTAYKKAFPKVDLKKYKPGAKELAAGVTAFEATALAEDIKNYSEK